MNVSAVPIELLQTLASFAPEQQRPYRNGHDHPFDIDDFVSRYSIKVKFEKPVSYGRLLILETCPFNGDHDHGEAHITVLNSGALGFSCKHNSCAFRKWKDLRELYESPKVPKTEPVKDHTGENLTDLGNAKRFAMQHGKILRYSHQRGAWLAWNDKRWQIDESGAAIACAKMTVRSIYGEAKDENDKDQRERLAD